MAESTRQIVKPDDYLIYVHAKVTSWIGYCGGKGIIMVSTKSNIKMELTSHEVIVHRPLPKF